MSNTSQTVHTFHKASTAIGAGVELTVFPNMSIANVDIDGTGIGVTITFEAKIDKDSDWRLIQGANLTTMSLETTVSSLGSVYQFDLSGFYKFRMNITTLATGNVTIIGRVVS